MDTNKINEVILFEHQFWLQILGDHGRFILNKLSPKETEYIEMANMFIDIFDKLLKVADGDIADDDIGRLNKDAYMAAMKFREFKLNIIKKQITDKIQISLPPTFINHMVNELDEYLLILTAINKGSFGNARPLHLHCLWLPDGAGHAAMIAGSLDMTEKQLMEEMKEYCKKFDNLYLRAIEYEGYTRTGVTNFPALDKLNVDASEIMNCFKEALHELKKYTAGNKVLGTLPPLAYDHMFREECYYLLKLSLVSSVDKPDCDPTKPRAE